MLAEVTADVQDFAHPLIEAREVRKRCVILVSTDKGLCGALNANLMREAAKFDKATTVYITAGRKASQFVARTKRQLAAEFTYKDAPLFSEARAISKFAQRSVHQRRSGPGGHSVYTNFISTLVQKPETVPFLPVGQIQRSPSQALTACDGRELPVASAPGVSEFLFEPNASRCWAPCCRTT